MVAAGVADCALPREADGVQVALVRNHEAAPTGAAVLGRERKARVPDRVGEERILKSEDGIDAICHIFPLCIFPE